MELSWMQNFAIFKGRVNLIVYYLFNSYEIALANLRQRIENSAMKVS